jgi:hypothetical protein
MPKYPEPYYFFYQGLYLLEKIANQQACEI